MGQIYKAAKSATFRVTAVSDLMIIIAHFVKYPLISVKSVQYNLWAQVVELIASKQHYIPATWNYIFSIYAALGRGASKAARRAFPDINPITLPQYICNITVSTLNPWWLSGYLTLYCSFRLNIDATGWGNSTFQKFQQSFSVSFDIVSLELAVVIAQYLGLSYYTRTDGSRVDVMTQSVTASISLGSFLTEYPLQSSKDQEFKVWMRYVDMKQRDIENNAHRQPTQPRYAAYHKLQIQLEKLQNP